MATKKKMLQAAAGNAGGEALDITDVFSTYLYTGNGSTQTITNDIDLAGEGGLVWVKNRGTGNATWHYLFDTERNAGLYSNSTSAEFSATGFLNSFNSNGFELGGTVLLTESGKDFASWTFRKAPKFFDVVTYTGTGSARTISHSLNTTPGLIICKPTSGSGQWAVWHRSNGNNNVLYLNLNYSNSFSNTVWNNTAPTSTVFSVGASAAGNESGVEYVAYLFAHNDGDGEFGPDGDQDMIKCGSYTGTATTGSPTIDLGFEPQFVFVKRTDSTGNWIIQDNMRSVNTTSTDMLFPNLSNAATTGSYATIVPTATGFYIGDNGTNYNASGGTYIYIAIRRGPLAPPESATEVFAIDTQGSTGDGQAPAFRSTFPVDTAFVKSTAGGGTTFASRLTGTKYLRPEETSAEYTNTQVVFDYMNGFRNSTITFAPNHGYLWKRAPNYFDVVAYTGDGVAGRTVSHNLGVAPEMMWVKKRNNPGSWAVYHKGVNGGVNPENYHLFLQSSSAEATDSNYYWYQTAPTATDFTLGISANVNQSSANNYIAYLFASLPGISKVGSYTGNGSSQTIDCGFTSGARFILIKRTDSTGDWYVWDTERGIVAGNDPYLELNTTDAEVTSTDWVDPDNSGFIVNGTTINASGGEYIFYSVA